MNCWGFQRRLKCQASQRPIQGRRYSQLPVAKKRAAPYLAALGTGAEQSPKMAALRVPMKCATLPENLEPVAWIFGSELKKTMRARQGRQQQQMCNNKDLEPRRVPEGLVQINDDTKTYQNVFFVFNQQ